MKFIINYKCNTNHGDFTHQFEFETNKKPTKTDPELIEAALKDSTKLHTTGLSGLSITSIILTH